MILIPFIFINLRMVALQLVLVCKGPSIYFTAYFYSLVLKSEVKAYHD